MTQTVRLSELKHFALDCLRLLYWVYFKPYTLRRYQQTIHNYLDIRDPFEMRSLWDDTPRLRLYAEQVWWITLLAPFAAILLIAPFYAWFVGGSPAINTSLQFMIGWLIGNWIPRVNLRRTSHFIFATSILVSLISAAEFYALEIATTMEMATTPSSRFIGILLNIATIIGSPTELINTIGIFYPVAWGIVLRMLIGSTPRVDWKIAVGIGGVIIAALLGEMKENIILISLATLYAVMIQNIDETNNILKNTLRLLVGIVIGSISLSSSDNWRVLLFALATLIYVRLDPVGISTVFIGGYSAIWMMNNTYLGTLSTISYLFVTLRIGFWFFEFLWSIFVGILSLFDRHRADRWLPLLPFWHDELILLSLPFQKILIIRSYKTQPTLAIQAINHLLNSANQRRTAGKATVGISKNLLKRCRTVNEISEVGDELSWITDLIAKETDVLLPQFLEISRSVKLAQKDKSLYRCHALLATPISILEQMRDGFAFDRYSRFDRLYSNIVKEWLALLQNARVLLAEEAQRSGMIPQVYVAGPSLDPERAGMRFKGREDVFREIGNLAMAAQPPVLIFYGGRRTGKTSALKYLPHRVGLDLVPLLIDVQGIASATSLTGIAERFATDIVVVARQARNLHLPYPDNLGRDPFPALLQWMEQVERTAPGKRFLLCLDEYERLSEVVESTGSRAPLNFLRHIIQHNPRWIVLFSGSHTLEELPAYWMDYLINSQALRVSYLAESEARELIEQPIPNFPAIYTAEVVDEIVQLTRCQPYLVQLTCLVLVDQLNREQRTLASLEDLHAAIPIIFERGAGHFLEFWRTTLTEAEQTFLLAFVAGTPIEPIHTPMLAQLARREVLERTNGAWRFQVPLMRRYVEQRLSEV